MRNSFDICRAELLAAGIDPNRPRETFAKSRPAADVLARLSPEGREAIDDLDRMFKSVPAWAFETEADREAQRLHRRVHGDRRRMAEMDRDIEQMTKSFAAAAARVSAGDLRAQPISEDDIVAKAHSALRHDHTLSAHDRGTLLIALGDRAGAVFAKSQAPHPMAAKIDKVRTMLEHARKNKHAERAEPIIEECLEHIKKGVVSDEDYGRLSALLSSLKMALAAGDTDAQ
jgi:hypothetical protein